MATSKKQQKIIGREMEMAELRRCMESDRSEFVIVYGRRRVGKTFLVDRFLMENTIFPLSEETIRQWQNNCVPLPNL